MTTLSRFAALVRAVAWLSVSCAWLGLLWPLCAYGFAQTAASIPEEIEWTWEVRPPHPDAALPNVLLLGDSISRNYFPQVTKDLGGVANVYLMASSTSVGDPRLELQLAEFKMMEGVNFRVVHFNNGMHGWGYSEANFKRSFPQFLEGVEKLVEGRGSANKASSISGSLIWASITPVRSDATSGATNPRIDQRNAIALGLIGPAKIVVDDQHALMANHPDLYEDSVHFNAAGAVLMGQQASASIRAALKK